MAYQQDQGRELGFDDVITKDADEFIVLTPGEYQFKVTELEKSRSKGSDKLPPSNMVIVTCTIESPEGSVNIKEYLVLHTNMEWKLSQFFGAIGLKKKGEPLRMSWQAVNNAVGKCQVINEQRDGNTYNKIKNFVMPDDYDQPATTTTAGGWAPGKF